MTISTTDIKLRTPERLILFISFLLLAGCASRPAYRAPQSTTVEKEIAGAFKRSEWTSKEKAAFISSIAGHTVDAASSIMSDERCVENHIFLGKNPSNAQLIGIKLVAIGFEFWLYNSPSVTSENTHWYGFTSAVLHGAVGVSNFRNDCY